MSENTELGSAVLFLVILVSTDLCAVESPESGNYIEVPPGTQLCDSAEDVYGFYLVKSPMNSDGSQDVEHYRFSPHSELQRPNCNATLCNGLGGTHNLKINCKPLTHSRVNLMNSLMLYVKSNGNGWG